LDAIIGQAITGVVTLGLAYIGYLRLKAGTDRLKNDVADVHTAVNSNLTLQQERNEQLTAALTAGGVVVPPPAQPGTTPTPEH
jgi:hypothetical protein